MKCQARDVAAGPLAAPERRSVKSLVDARANRSDQATG
jgi:hypothetical protein